MQAIKARRAAGQPVSNRFLFVGVIFIVFVLGVYAFNLLRASQAAALSQKVVVISQNTLEEQYGLRVTLVAVTAAGGMLDLRLKVLDGEKAKTLLLDPKNYPALQVAGSLLTVPADTKALGLNLKTGANIYLLFSNSHSLAQSGVPVTVMFGDTAIEPIPAK